MYAAPRRPGCVHARLLTALSPGMYRSYQLLCKKKTLFMALYLYFQASNKVNYKLPDPRGPLSRVVPSSSIASANEKVKSLIGNKKHD